MVELLKQYAVFKELGSEELEEVARIVRLVQFKKGDHIFEAGEDAIFLYIVDNGEVELQFSVFHLNAPVVLTLTTMKKGATFGWSAIAAPYRYTLSARAKSDTQLLRLSAGEIRSLCERNKHLGYVVMNNIATIVSSRFTAMQGLLKHIIQGNLE